MSLIEKKDDGDSSVIGKNRVIGIVSLLKHHESKSIILTPV